MVIMGPQFALLVAITWIAFFAVPPGRRSLVLTAAGVAWYAAAAPFSLWLVVPLILTAHAANGRRLKWIAVLILLGVLAYFKRPAGLISGVAALRGEGSPWIALGLSFLTFELIHFIIDRGRGRIGDPSLLDLTAFALFFPCRAAGPIKRYREFTASVAAAEPLAANVSAGCLRILSGLFKKLALADGLARLAPDIATVDTPLLAWMAMVAYSLELYFDFSAYSDIAVGTSRVLGIRVPENFNWPYLAPNVQEFWNRWHMSLSSWARDYVFTSTGRKLFKTRLRAHPQVIAATSFLVTFLAIGAWHGLSLNFLTWGAYHGVLVTLFHFYQSALPLQVATSRFYRSRAVSWAGTALTFVLVTLGWVFFRLDAAESGRVLRLMLTG